MFLLQTLFSAKTEVKIVSFKKSLQTLIHSKIKFVGLICLLLILARFGPHKDQMYVSLGQLVQSGDWARTSNKDLMAESRSTNIHEYISSQDFSSDQTLSRRDWFQIFSI